LPTRRARGGVYTRAMRFPSATLVVVCFAACLGAPPASAMTPNDRRFVSARQGVSVEAPPGWTLSTHTGFPSILVLLLHPDGSRISVAVSDTQARDAREVAETNRRALEQQTGSAVTARAGARSGVQLDGQASSRHEAIVQLYLVRPFGPEGARQAIVLSLVAPQAAIALRRADLDFVIAKLGLTQPTVSATPAPTPTPNARPGSGGERGAEKERR
jgi:hypothetical protein